MEGQQPEEQYACGGQEDHPEEQEDIGIFVEEELFQGGLREGDADHEHGERDGTVTHVSAEGNDRLGKSDSGQETDDSDDSVQTGRTVTIRDMKSKKDFTYKIVGTTEADPLNGKLSNASAVGQHLMGHHAGETVEFPVPNGVAKYKIVEVKK